MFTNVIDSSERLFSQDSLLAGPNGPAKNERRFPSSLLSAKGILDTLLYPMLLLDCGLRVKAVNWAFCDTFAVTQREIEGCTVRELCNGVWNHPMLRSLLENLHLHDQPFDNFEVTQILPSGDSWAIRLSGRKLSSDTYGEELIIVGIEDITERRRAEEIVSAAKTEMEREAVELRRSNEDLKQFARVVAHDLRAPLLGVLQYNEKLRDACQDKVDDEAMLYFEYITQSAQRMTLLIEDLLFCAQAAAAGKETRELTDTHVIIQAAVANLRTSISEAKAIITHDALPQVKINPAQFLQVVQNLISNAIQYRNGSQPRIHISAARQDEYWRFAIHDNGIGIEPQNCSVIFEPFKRLHGSDRPGFGLGLAACKRIVERHGGQIWVESEVDRGSTFFFTLQA